MKQKIRELLVRQGIYFHLKYSRLFHLYQLLFKPGDIKEQKQEKHFYRSFLPACHLIFDIGANDGHKTEAFLTIADKVVCCEPDPQNFKILQIRFRNRKKKVVLENKALSDKEGSAEFYVHYPASAFNTLSNKWKKLLEEDNEEKWDEQIQFTETQIVKTTTLDQLINKYGQPDFIKIDVEGYEEFVLKGLSHRVSCISFETLLPDYQREMQNCLAITQALDPSSMYNIALQEKLVLPEFVGITELGNWLHANNITRSFEVIVKMSV